MRRSSPWQCDTLTTNNSEGASLAFSPDGRFLVVSERATNNIDVFPVRPDGTLGTIVVNSDEEPGLFAITFAPNGGVGLGDRTGRRQQCFHNLLVLGACKWNHFPSQHRSSHAWKCKLLERGYANGRWAYASNAGSSTIAGFSIGDGGALTPIGATIVGVNPTGSGNLDIADSKFLYSLNSGNGTIGVFGIQEDGSLLNLGETEGISAKAGFNGIAAF